MRAGAFSWRFARSDTAPTRVGFVFSSRSGSSVLRHRFKRRFRELVRLNGCATPLSVVITPHKNLNQISDADWQQHKTRFIAFLKQHAA